MKSNYANLHLANLEQTFYPPRAVPCYARLMAQG